MNYMIIVKKKYWRIYIHIFHKCELGREKYAEINGSQVASEEANRKIDHCGQ